MLPHRTQAKQHDDEVDSSANANPRLPQAQFSLPQVANPQANLVVPRQALPHSNTGHPLVIPVIPIVPTVLVASTFVP